nr:ATP-binding protein [Butyrivibrio sp.]
MVDLYLDIPRLYTAIAEWCACMVFCMPLKKKISNGLYVLYSILFLLIQSAFLYYTDNVPDIIWIPCMAVAI